MYEYHYERVHAKWNGMNDPLYGMNYQLQEYKEIIEVMAKNGWRYVGFLPIIQRSHGAIEEFDLIFERQIS